MQKNTNNFNEFLTKSKFYKNENHNNNEENDDALVVQYLSNKESDDNSYDINADNNINDSFDINKTLSSIEYETEVKRGKKLGISIHNIHKKNNNDKMTKFEKDNDLGKFTYHRNKTLNLGENKNRRNQRKISEEKINNRIKINSPEKRNLNKLSEISPKKKKISFKEPIVQHSDKSMIKSVYIRNKNLNINQNISLDNEKEINIEKNKKKRKRYGDNNPS
jgi:hypothetical protein